MNVPHLPPSSIGNEDLVGRRVLLVDDDPTVAEVASSYLRATGFVVEEASDGFAALEAAERVAPDLIVLDRMLPGIDGLEVFRRLRERMSTPVILLTALGSEDDRIAGLEAGADDYLSKPFSTRELVLRVQSVLRRSIGEFTPESVLEYGEFRLDPSAHVATRAGVELALTAREFDLFEFLLKHPNQVFSREELLRTVWGWTYGDLSTVTVHVRRLREKIERDPRSPVLLTTVWGVGYRFTMGGVSDAVV
ncbi:response regulator transcription factor [Agromyces albus]|uniref:response regulator transcription factor n=1 Tax=Agromyces albus TaxID=205332 RepID=UPI0027861E90|nr:response regulator transcription factor [Agromyces albus]MDQ0577626.1 DNA-binding response OmpR family regulator [Agromyces albus]